MLSSIKGKKYSSTIDKAKACYPKKWMTNYSLFGRVLHTQAKEAGCWSSVKPLTGNFPHAKF